MAFLQPDPEHPVVLENDSRWRKFLRIRNYGSMEITYSVYGGQRDLYLASSRDDMVLPGIAGENMEGSAVLQEDGRVWIRFVLARPHDGGTVEGIPIRFFYSPDKNTVEELHVESFTGSDNVVYTLDYTNQDALSDGAVVYEIIRTFEAFLESNEIRVGYDFGR